MNGNNQNAFNLVLVRYFFIKFLKRSWTKLETSKHGWKCKIGWSFFLQQVTTYDEKWPNCLELVTDLHHPMLFVKLKFPVKFGTNLLIRASKMLLKNLRKIMISHAKSFLSAIIWKDSSQLKLYSTFCLQ